jgi:hypothetical protein
MVQIVSQLTDSAACAPLSETQTAAPPARLRKTCPAKPCRGALGFRARQTRKQEYSVINHLAADSTSRAQPKTNSKYKPKPSGNTDTVN